MNSRERVLATLSGEKPDFVPVYDVLWTETVARWRKEGLPDGDPHRLLGFDAERLPTPDLSFQFPEETIEETPDYIIKKDANGITLQRTPDAHTPHWLDWTLKGPAEWKCYKERLSWNQARIPPDTRPQYNELKGKNIYTWFFSSAPYEAMWPVFGQVRILELMLDDPALIKDVFKTYTDLLLKAADEYLKAGIDFDGAFLCGDLGYNKGLLFSPALYDELLFDQHRRICRFFHEHDKHVILHSCGRIEQLIPRFIEAGFDGINPIEAKCGQDIRRWEVWGKKIVWNGNIDVLTLAADKNRIAAEVSSKVKSGLAGRGFFFHSDHSVPPDVSLSNYKLALEIARSIT